MVPVQVGEQDRAVERCALQQWRYALDPDTRVEYQRRFRGVVMRERQTGGVPAVADEVDAGRGARSPQKWTRKLSSTQGAGARVRRL
jgi:hypothetical protein